MFVWIVQKNTHRNHALHRYRQLSLETTNALETRLWSSFSSGVKYRDNLLFTTMIALPGQVLGSRY